METLPNEPVEDDEPLIFALAPLEIIFPVVDVIPPANVAL